MFLEIEISEELLGFLKENFPMARQRGVTPDDKLLERGIVDSLGLLTIVEYIESTYSIAVRNEDLVMENFGTIRSLAAFVARSVERVRTA